MPRIEYARPIRRLLVANRGEIAARVFQTCDELGIETVAVYSDPDTDAPYVRAAGCSVPLGGSAPAETYLDGAKILAAAVRSGADAVHPGYGFLAENADFAQAVIDAGLVWVGPRPASVRSMGSKIEAKRLAVAAGVPIAPSAELGTGDDPVGWRAQAERVGFPLLVKASAGGGGRGMRLVHGADDLVEAVRSASREAESAFGDATVFLERYLAGARHVEVQVLGDQTGHVIHLLERECSIQRRHQKIIEETPSPGLDEETRRAMCAAAVALAREVRYVGVGTVEFLVVGDGGQQEFSFLEMNTRLQVEHPITEEFVGLDLVRLQLEVAQGTAQRWIEEGTAFEGDLLDDEDDEDDELDLSDEQLDLADLRPVAGFGHAIEARLYAEDPAQHYLPSAGLLRLFEPGGTDVRWDSGVETGSVVSTHYDALLAKVIASGEDRAAVALRLAAALRATRVHGLRTNRDQLVAVLESAPFLAGGTPTDFLDLFPELTAPQVPAEVAVAHLVAAVLAGVRRRVLERTPLVAPGWRNVGPARLPQLVRFETATGPVEVYYLLEAVGGGATVSVEGVEHFARLRPSARRPDPISVRDLQLDLEVDGLRAEYRVAHYPQDAHDIDGGALVCVDGAGWSTEVRELPRFADLDFSASAAGPTAPMPGTVTAVAVSVGDHVSAGQVLVVLEAMKMEHRITSAIDGTVTDVAVAVGDSVDAHQLVATVRPPEAPDA